LLVPLLCVSMAERKLAAKRCKNLTVKVDQESGIQFVNQLDVEQLLTEQGSDPIRGSRLSDLELKKLESRVKKNKLIRNCQAYRDLEGNLVVVVEQQRPLARWIATSAEGEWRQSTGFYINEEGDFLPLTDRYSARTLLVSGRFFQQRNHLRTPAGRPVLELIKYLCADEFWKAQIIHIQVAGDGEVELLTALGDQRIELGPAENFEPKLNKLRIFYEKVLASDWSRYSRISVKFQDQIVCE
jgi:cell division protein FtsQ